MDYLWLSLVLLVQVLAHANDLFYYVELDFRILNLLAVRLGVLVMRMDLQIMYLRLYKMLVNFLKIMNDKWLLFSMLLLLILVDFV